MKASAVVIFCFLFIVGCNDSTAPSTEAGADTTHLPAAATGLMIQPQLPGADSMQILYFKKPFTDKKRYTRYFTVFSSSDTALVHTVVNSFDQSFSVRNEGDTCLSEGKIYLYSKKEPVKTVYFSTACAACCYLYFIKDGQFYYFSLPPAVRAVLDANRKQAITPTAKDIVEE